MSVAEQDLIDIEQVEDNPILGDMIVHAEKLMQTAEGNDNFEKMAYLAKNLPENGSSGAFALLGYLYLGLSGALIGANPDMPIWNAVEMISDTVTDVLTLHAQNAFPSLKS